MKIVRHNTFETNSSSTHSVSLVSGSKITTADLEHSLGVLRRHKIGAEVVIDFTARQKIDDETLGCVNRTWAEGIDHTTPLEGLDGVVILGYGDVVGKLLITLAACLGDVFYGLGSDSLEALKKSVYVRGTGDLVFTSKALSPTLRNSEDVGSKMPILLDIMSYLANNLQANIVFRTDFDLSESLNPMVDALDGLRYYLYTDYYHVYDDIDINFILNPRAYVVFNTAGND